jgi:RNA polymerase sigma factor (sigma-70 family)
LTQREHGLPPSPDLEAAWDEFYDRYARKIRAYAFTCGARDEEVVDCVQEVWRELLVRLPRYQHDPGRGHFDTWLFRIVQSKTVNLRRSRKRRMIQGGSDALQDVTDCHPGPQQTLEEEETVAVIWNRLRKKLSACTLQVLHLRLAEQRPVAEVAERLGLSHEQVWYRYHRARRELEEIGSALGRDQRSPSPPCGLAHEKGVKDQEFAQGKTNCAVSRNVESGSLARQGDCCVDYVFQRLELGRRELSPEWKVEWNCDAVPRPVLYIRKMAIVAYAEMCAPADFINTHWPRIVNAAIAAGVAAGIATIIATPTAALPIFQTEFHKHLYGKEASAVDEKIQVALSAKQEANGPWCACKD